MPFVTTMVLVTTSVRSGRVSRFPLVRCIARAVCRQPQPVGLWSAWRMRNKLRKICTHHRLEDRLRGTTRTNHRGYHTPIRTTEQSLADSPRCTLSGSREGESLPGGAQRSPPTTSITAKSQQSSNSLSLSGDICARITSFLRRGGEPSMDGVRHEGPPAPPAWHGGSRPRCLQR
jgi:hypothetical protein